MIAPIVVVPAVAAMIFCAPGTGAQREVAPMHVHSFGSDTLVRGTYTVGVTGLQTSGRNAVDSAVRKPELSLEEAFAEWTEESYEMAEEMWHYSASDTRDV